MTIIHFCAGLEPWNGMANTARQFVAEERAAGHDSELTNDLTTLHLHLSPTPTASIRLHIHGTWRPILWKAVKMAKAAGAEVIVRPAGNYDPMRLKHGIWKRFKKWAAGPCERAMLRRANVIQATCEAERDWIAEYLGSRGQGSKSKKGDKFHSSTSTLNFNSKIQITDLKRFFKLDTPIVRPKADRCMDPLHVMFLGRAEDPLKGVKYLELAVSELNYWAMTYLPKCPKGGVVELRIVCNHRGEELEKDWEWCDVLCLPTLSENFGRVIAEAIEHGRSVITTDGAPAWEPEKAVKKVVSGQRLAVSDGNASDNLKKPLSENALIYLRGYREGSERQRIELLKDALKGFID